MLALGRFRISPPGSHACRGVARACGSVSMAAPSIRPMTGHRLVSLMALKRLGLDRVWWIVTPGNPLKDTGELASAGRACGGCAAGERASAHRCDRLSRQAIGSRYTVDTLAYLKRRYPGRPFRLDHGGGQSGGLPSLARLARHRPDDADRRDRPAGLDPEGDPFPRGCRIGLSHRSMKGRQRPCPCCGRRPGSSSTDRAPTCRRPSCGACDELLPPRDVEIRCRSALS